MRQALEGRARPALHGSALVRAEARETPFEELAQALVEHLARLLEELRHRGRGPAPRIAQEQGVQAAFDDLRGTGGRGRPQLAVLLRARAQRLEIDALDPFILDRLEVARKGEIDGDERASMTRVCGEPRERASVEDEAGRGRGGTHDVDGDFAASERLQLERHRSRTTHESRGARQGSVGHPRDGQARALQRAEGLRRGLARSDHRDDRPETRIPESLDELGDGDADDGDRMPRELRLRAHLFADAKGLFEERSKQRADQAHGSGPVVGGPELGQDLIFADDQGFERGRDPKKVAHGSAADAEPDEWRELVLLRESKGAPHLGEIGAGRWMPGLASEGDFDAVARREEDELRGRELVGEPAQKCIEVLGPRPPKSLQSADVGLMQREPGYRNALHGVKVRTRSVSTVMVVSWPGRGGARPASDEMLGDAEAVMVRPHSPADSRSLGILLVNLGSPAAPTSRAVRRFLSEFLSDRAVVDANPFLWWLVRRLIVLPFRSRKSARLYQRIWTDAGSPLTVNSRRLRERLAAKLGAGFRAALAMRYGEPSIESALDDLLEIERLLLVPLFPQASRATTGTIEHRVREALAKRERAPELEVISPFFEHEAYIACLAALARDALARGPVDHVVLSFHGLPERYVEEGDPYLDHCQRTARALARALELPAGEGESWTLAFQSRFGRGAWLSPSTSEVLLALARKGARVLVVFPGFVADCLETLEEIGLRAREAFHAAGGAELRLVPCLNDEPRWIAAVARIVREQLGVSTPSHLPPSS